MEPDGQKENSNGKQLRELFLNIITCAWPIPFIQSGQPGGVNTQHPESTTLLLPDMLPQVKRCQIYHRSGAALQKIATPGWRDYRPLHCSFTHKLCYAEEKRQNSCGWEWELLARGVFSGTRRGELLGRVEVALADERLDELSHGTPSPFWKLFNQKFMRSPWECMEGNSLTTQSRMTQWLTTGSTCSRKLLHYLRCGYKNKMMASCLLMCKGCFTHGLQLLSSGKHAKYMNNSNVIRARVSGLLHEFQDAWLSRSALRMWRVARSLSGRALGPKRRRFDVPLAAQPTVEQWSSHFAQDGPSGGCLSRQYWKGMTHSLRAKMISQLCASQEKHYPGQSWMCEWCALQIRKQPMRKSVPQWVFLQYGVSCCGSILSDASNVPVRFGKSAKRTKSAKETERRDASHYALSIVWIVWANVLTSTYGGVECRRAPDLTHIVEIQSDFMLSPCLGSI